MPLLSPLFDHALRAAQAMLPAFGQKDCVCGLSRQERLGLILSAVDRCGTDCPTWAIWALEQDGYQPSSDAESSERRLPC